VVADLRGVEGIFAELELPDLVEQGVELGARLRVPSRLRRRGQGGQPRIAPQESVDHHGFLLNWAKS
jgi:hypothetical protein